MKKYENLECLKFLIHIFLFFSWLIITPAHYLSAAEKKIESVPLINLEELSPTFEEDKDLN